jgi:hypothetical protein
MKKLTHRPEPGDYFESYLESKKIDSESNLTWEKVYEKDLKQWNEQNNKHQLEYSIWSCKVSWCPICKQHFYNSENHGN